MNQVKDLKDILESARNKIDYYKEPIQEAGQIRDLLNTILEDPTFLTEKVDEEFRKFFFEDFTSQILKRLVRENPRNEIVNSIFSYILVPSSY